MATPGAGRRAREQGADDFGDHDDLGISGGVLISSLDPLTDAIDIAAI